MSKPKVLTLVVSVVFVLTLVSSARADSVRVPPGLEKLNVVESFGVPDIILDDVGFVFAEHFANNNGKHLGFSVAAFHGGLKFGLANPRRQPSLSNPANPGSQGSTGSILQSPEPTAMILLGTGLAAGAAFARRWNRKRRP